MNDEKFLKQISDYYIDKKIDLSTLTFVFPNRRSAMFMRSYLQKSATAPMFMPRMISITYFTQQYDKSAIASNTELVLILYKVYCDVLRRHGKESQIPDFDNFYFWGTIILSDFNEVDAYMADASQLFRNLKGLKEIKSNYLTPEQIEVAEHLWGKNTIYQSTDNFWQHIPSTPGEEAPSKKFLNLWEILGELYSEYIKKLDSLPTPLAYSGLQSRRAYQTIKHMGKDDFKGHRFVFVGFNVLSTARHLIFRHLKTLGIADFFWDVASPHLVDDTGTPSNAGRMIIPLSRTFKMPGDFELQRPASPTKISIISVPSSTGQAKVASNIINQWAQEWSATNSSGCPEDADLIDTAVVFPDDHLLTPMLCSVPPAIPTINVTMGISYHATPFAALMSSLISMHLRAYKVRGEYHYYYQDVTEVLSHPHITLLFPKHAEEIKEKIQSHHLFNIHACDLIKDYPDLAFIFTPIDDMKDIRQVSAYISTLVDTLTRLLNSYIGHADSKNYYELEVLAGYAKAVEELCDLTERYDVSLHERTFLQMIERTVSTTPINFTGEPLKGLQLMGVMDTRALDFSNLILLSMNERVFPKRNYNPSLIPASLRAGYMLPTQEDEESTYAYQFYRLISRAKRVSLLYDSRTSGISSGEMSRYLSQLIHLSAPGAITVKNVEMNAEIKEVKPIVVNKTESVIADLRRFRPGGDLKLSASALKTYLSCPLRFYLQYVKGLRINEEVLEYIDAASYGTVTHRVVQSLYRPYEEKRITEGVIDSMLNSDIEELARTTLDEIYYKSRYNAHPDDMPGEGRITAKIIAQYVRYMLKAEKKAAASTPMIFRGAEVGEKILRHWRINDKYTLNFTMSIDRIDALGDYADPKEETLTFIDYKTGGDELKAPNVASLFENSKFGGIFQLLVYSHAYADIEGHRGAIQPKIYRFQTMATEGIPPLKLNSKSLEDYRQADAPDKNGDTFREKFEEMIDAIFEEDNAHPFTQTEDIDHCSYCPFKQICSRYPEDNKY